MSLKEELIAELESTRKEYIQLVESIPVEAYGHSSGNPAWKIGDILYHITLGPAAVLAEVWMIRHAGWLFTIFLNNRTAGIFNWGNAWFARHRIRMTPQLLIRAYERGHAGLLASLQRMPDAEFSKSVCYPDSFVAELAGRVTVERLFRYIKLHFEVHARQIRERSGRILV
jgi:hypothetical protein